MGFMQKAVFIGTGGLSGLVSKAEAPAKTSGKGRSTDKQRKAARPKAQAAGRSKSSASRRAKPRPASMRAAAKTVPPGEGTADQLERIAKLHGMGSLTDEEFAAAKAKILGMSLAPGPPEAGPAAERGSSSDRGSATFRTIEANIAAHRHLTDLAGQQGRGASITRMGED